MAKTIVNSGVAAQSDNVGRAVKFYRKLGIKPSLNYGDYAEFKIPGGTVLGLYKMGKKRVKHPSGGWQIMLRVKKIEQVMAALKRKGVRCSPVELLPGNAKLSWILDPDGNRLV